MVHLLPLASANGWEIGGIGGFSPIAVPYTMGLKPLVCESSVIRQLKLTAIMDFKTAT